MSDELAELQKKSAIVIRKRLKSTHEAVKHAQGAVKGMKMAIVPDGTKEILKTISGKLEEAELMYVKAFSSLVTAFGDDPAEKEGPRIPTQEELAEEEMLAT